LYKKRTTTSKVREGAREGATARLERRGEERRGGERMDAC
jgi:hypothetical protein